MTATTVLPPVRPGLPLWATYTLVGDHPPCPQTWTCTRCPNSPQWPCAFARDHAAELARQTPVSGEVWLRWCATTAAGVLEEHRDVVWARIVGWYLRQVDRVDAYRGNRGQWWRRPFHG